MEGPISGNNGAPVNIVEGTHVLNLCTSEAVPLAVRRYPTQTDFSYRDGDAAIYLDRPPHDTPPQLREDDSTSKTLIEMGYNEIRFHHDGDWHSIFPRHRDPFGALGE